VSRVWRFCDFCPFLGGCTSGMCAMIVQLSTIARPNRFFLPYTRLLHPLCQTHVMLATLISDVYYIFCCHQGSSVASGVRYCLCIFYTGCSSCWHGETIQTATNKNLKVFWHAVCFLPLEPWLFSVYDVWHMLVETNQKFGWRRLDHIDGHYVLARKIVPSAARSIWIVSFLRNCTHGNGNP
jgi:hypothetical protein